MGADLKKHVEAAADELDAFIYRHVECYLPKEGINGNGNGFAPILRRLALAVRRDTLNEAAGVADTVGKHGEKKQWDPIFESGYFNGAAETAKRLRSLLPQEER